MCGRFVKQEIRAIKLIGAPPTISPRTNLVMDNPLLRSPLTAEDIKPRLLGHWSTTPRVELHLCPSEPQHRQARPHERLDHEEYITRGGDDLPEIREWTWSAAPEASSAAAKGFAHQARAL